ncbi:MAG TPA: hypothetical protein PLM96_01465 [Methanoregulaceae archaeon]|nr:hypothetical protein [Methanolinea sp.]MDD3090401.1 hypothetical protein [Methanoregulaceae archaeon]MDD5047996.1 hypothetical protein [Methanoregulaceae archaeon]HOP66744.1 hypothetical protein [Methanoregulaceae archaeon]HPJ73406.1 hypothetical protein [Methanoregulaceae archaeon]
MKVTQDSLVLSHSLVVGLICSRSLEESGSLVSSVQSVFSRIGHILHSTPHTLTILAGDNRCRELEVLNEIGVSSAESPRYEKVILYLPSDPDTYLQGINDASHRECFTRYSGNVDEVRTISSPENGGFGLSGSDEAVIRDCDLLVLASRGRPEEDTRTLDILRFARLVGRSLFHINARNGSVIEMRNNDRFLETLEHLNTYNRERLDEGTFEDTLRIYANIITRKVIRSGIPPDVIRPLCGTIMPHFVRAHRLSSRYQDLYKSAGNLVFALSALAVLTITVQTLFFPSATWLIWLEVIEIAVILALLVSSRLGEWHRKWIDYRFLAERTRAAFFLCIICIHCEKPPESAYINLGHRENDWMDIAFEGILRMRPMEFCRLDIPFLPLKNFLLDAWVDNRLAYYSRSSEKNSTRYNLFAYLGESIFFITLILAVAHATGHEFEEALGIPLLPLILVTLTITLPAVGAALSAIRVQREYLKNSERYAHIVRHLSSVRNRIHASRDLKTLCELLEEMNEVIMQEQQDWRITFRFRDIEA